MLSRFAATVAGPKGTAARGAPLAMHISNLEKTR